MTYLRNNVVTMRGNLKIIDHEDSFYFLASKEQKRTGAELSSDY